MFSWCTKKHASLFTKLFLAHNINSIYRFNSDVSNSLHYIIQYD